MLSVAVFELGMTGIPFFSVMLIAMRSAGVTPLHPIVTVTFFSFPGDLALLTFSPLPLKMFNLL